MLVYAATAASFAAIALITIYLRQDPAPGYVRRVAPALRSAILPFLAVGVFFCVLQIWLRSTSDLQSASATIGIIEKAIARLNAITSYLDLSPWQKLGSIVILILLA